MPVFADQGLSVCGYDRQRGFQLMARVADELTLLDECLLDRFDHAQDQHRSADAEQQPGAGGDDDRRDQELSRVFSGETVVEDDQLPRVIRQVANHIILALNLSLSLILRKDPFCQFSQFLFCIQVFPNGD